MKKYLLHLVSVAALLALGYFYRAYTEKPKIVEVPKERTITKTIYIDKITKVPVEVITEHTVYDPDAAVQIEKLKAPKVLVGIAYGVVTDYGAPVWGAWVQKKLIGPIYLGVAAYTDQSVMLTAGMEF